MKEKEKDQELELELAIQQRHDPFGDFSVVLAKGDKRAVVTVGTSCT